MHQFFFDSGSEKRFQASGMRAIDSPHKFTPRKSKNFRFSLQCTHSDSLIQERIFKTILQLKKSSLSKKVQLLKSLVGILLPHFSSITCALNGTKKSDP